MTIVPMRRPEEDGRSMVARVTTILHAFRPGESSVGISELARRTGLPKSSVARIVGELVEHRLLERNSTGVHLGIRVFELGEAVPRRHDLRRLALPYMADLRAALNLTVHLAVLEGNEVVYVDILRSREAPRLSTRVGGRLPAYSTAVGKAFLAWSTDAVVDAALAGPLRPLGPGTITSSDALRRELAQIRETGVAYDREESRSGISAVATAVLGPGNTPLLAVSAVGRTDEVATERVAQAVRAAGIMLSHAVSRHPDVGRLIS